MRRVMKRMVAREQVRQGVSNVQEGAIVDALARVIETYIAPLSEIDEDHVTTVAQTSGSEGAQPADLGHRGPSFHPVGAVSNIGLPVIRHRPEPDRPCPGVLNWTRTHWLRGCGDSLLPCSRPLGGMVAGVRRLGVLYGVKRVGRPGWTPTT